MHSCLNHLKFLVHVFYVFCVVLDLNQDILQKYQRQDVEDQQNVQQF
jgi:hypothetical protein